jgi:hypothetical protein
MHLSPNFEILFRKESYAVNLALSEERQLENIYDEILSKRSIEGVWDKEYSVVPIGALNGREEGEDLPEKTMCTGYTTFGSVAIEATGKVGLSKILKQRSKEFAAAGGDVDEPKFAGYLADTASKGFLIRAAQKRRQFAAKIFNLGGIQAGSTFFDMNARCHMSDVPASNLIYDGKPLFALPANAHPSYAAAAVIGVGAQPVGTCVNFAATIADTGGYFNAFQFPPSYWALKRVWTHFVNNMQFDENDEREVAYPDTLLVSAYDYMLWTEILRSKFIEPYVTGRTTNRENIFMMEGFKMRLVASPDLINRTWYVGQSKSQGILMLEPTKEEDPWAYWRDEKDRSYWISFEDQWGFMVRNWRRWCAGSISTDGATPPSYGDPTTWDTIPAGV